jgi:hypothetical protein
MYQTFHHVIWMEQIRVKLKMYAYRLHIELWKDSLNSDGQQFHQYQQNKESLNSDGQQFHQYQQNKESLNSDGQQFHLYQHTEQPPLTSNHWIQVRQQHMVFEI